MLITEIRSRKNREGKNICLVLRRRSDEMMNEANENSSAKYAGQKHIRTFCSKEALLFHVICSK